MHGNTVDYMSKNSAEPDELSILLAESTEVSAEEIERRASEFEIENLEEAEWEYIDE